MEIDDTQPHGRHRPQHRFEQLYIDLFQYPMERDGLLIWAGAKTPGFDLSELTGPGCLHAEVLLF